MDTRRLFQFFVNFRLFFPALVRTVTDFRSSLIKAHKCKLRLGFLRHCLSEQVIPVSIIPKRLLRLSDKPFDDVQRLILQKHIRITKYEVDEAFSICKKKRHVFDTSIPQEWKNCLLDFCYDKLRRECVSIERNLNRKLKRLIENSNWTKHANYEFMVNLSDKVLDDVTKSALGYGISFSVTKKEIDWVSIANSFCNLERNMTIPMMILTYVKV